MPAEYPFLKKNFSNIHRNKDDSGKNLCRITSKSQKVECDEIKKKEIDLLFNENWIKPELIH